MRSPVPKVRTSTWWRYFSGTARRWWCLKDSGWRSMSHLGAAQGGEVLADVGLGDVGSGHQEADHERGVEDLAEAEGLRDVQGDPEQGGRRHLPVQQRVEPLVGRPLEGEGGLFRGEHRVEACTVAKWLPEW
jgi:hypothetical protein